MLGKPSIRNGFKKLQNFTLKLFNLIVFRDPLGIKPIYYMVTDDVFYFSSELKPFIKVNPLQLNSNKLIEYAACGSILGQETLFKNIREIEPGHFIKVDSTLMSTVINTSISLTHLTILMISMTFML